MNPPKTSIAESYLRLSDWVHPKRVEYPAIYDATNDELYELNDEGYDFIRKCDGRSLCRELEPEPEEEFLQTCLESGLLTAQNRPTPRGMPPDLSGPIPSLRYLEVQLTSRCNLKCGHCYLGPAVDNDLSLSKAISLFNEFEKMQGMRILLTGGEPLLNPSFWGIHDEVVSKSFRVLLLTNGHLLTAEVAKKLKVDEVQVSIDGMENGHDAIRGNGSFRKALVGLKNLLSVGLECSVATVVHRENVEEFQQLEDLLIELGIERWGIDAVCKAGNAVGKDIFDVEPIKAANLMRYAFGGAFHGEASAEGCGSHLATITPTGQVLRCGFYPESPLGDIRSGLENAWKQKKAWPLKGSTCSACSEIENCGGGCRFRALNESSPDPVMCLLHLGELPD